MLKEYKDKSAMKLVRLDEQKKLLKDFKRGDCVLREGTLCMVLEHGKGMEPDPKNGYASYVCIVNLGTGRAWFADGEQEVREAKNVECTFQIEPL